MSTKNVSAYALTALALACTQALAQSAQDETPRGARLEQIDVLGSHIRRVDMETQHPVQVIEREELLRTGLTDIGDILQTVTAAGQSRYSRTSNNGNDGQTRLNLRSLGTERTLVLMDGHRLATTLDGAVDLTAIPMAIIERVEILKDGASAIYGSDAIAGVVNIVTRRDYKGGEFAVNAGENEHGDGFTRGAEVTYGGTGQGWSAAGGVSFSKADPIFARDRAISAVPVYGLPINGSGSSITGNSMLIRESGRQVRLLNGRDGTSPDDFGPNSGFDRYNYAERNYLYTPAERRAAFGKARFEFSPDLAFSGDVLYNERRSSQQLAEPVVVFNPFAVGPERDIVISPDNVYNPFGETILGATRRFIEAGPRRNSQKVGTTRVHAGLDGLFTLGSRDYTWGVDYTYTRANQREFVTPFADNRKMALALGPSFRDASGVARCGTPDAVIAGCVPLNLFGPRGSITPEMLDYIGDSATNHRRSESRDFAVHAEGDIFDLPAGPLAVAVGYEHRKESGSDTPDDILVSGNANGTGGFYSDTGGSYSVDEAWVEFNAPLLSDVAFARQLDLSIASRFSDYSLFGNTTNSQAGLRWKPIDDVLVRTNIAQGFRAPSVRDLFEGHIGVAGVYDICAPENGASDGTLARCVAAGLPADLPDNPAAYAINGGNVGLKPETALTRSLGVVYSPRWLDGLEANIDWYRVQIRDAIDGRSVDAILDDCYSRGDPTACARITRNADGTLNNVVATYENMPGGLEVEGFDFGATFRRSTSAGNFSLAWDNTYVSYTGELHQPGRGTILPNGLPAQGNTVGDVRTPGGFYDVIWRLRSTVKLNWSQGPWSASIGARYFSPMDENCDAAATAAFLTGDPDLINVCSNPDHMADLDGSGVLQEAPQNRVASVTFTDLEASWDAPWQARFTLGVRNAFDRDPPVAYSAFANSYFSGYDVPGRYWYASYRQRF